MKQASRRAICLLIICAASISALSQEKRQRLPYRFLIPEGYVGWVRVDFGVAGAPALPAEDNYYILKIPPNGYLKTSSHRTEVRGEQYYYFSDSTKYRLSVSTSSDTCMIQYRFTGPDPSSEPHHQYIYVFVGPLVEYNKCKFNEPCNERDEDDYPKTGPRLILTKEELERLNIGRP